MLHQQVKALTAKPELVLSEPYGRERTDSSELFYDICMLYVT